MTASAPDPPGYTYAQVADRIEATLGVRPALSTLRVDNMRPGRATNSRMRITAGMPTPFRTRPRALFDTQEVEAWLADHPRLRVSKAATRLQQASQELDEAVVAASLEGLSWAQIANILTQTSGRNHFRQALHRTYAQAVDQATQPRPSDP